MSSSKLIYSFEEVKAHFELKGCKILSQKYHNAETLIDYICKCGRAKKKSFHDFKRGDGFCRQCPTQKIEDIKSIFEKENCKLLSTKYDPYSKLEYICSCGNNSSVTLANFKNGVRCKNCRVKRIAKSQALKIQEVESIFQSFGWSLIDKEYKNNKTKLLAKCSCGKSHKVSLSIVKTGSKCPDCGKSKTSFKNSGSKHYKYDANISLEERLDKRNSSTIRAWKLNVKKLLGKNCIVCKDTSKIEIHHIFSYKTHKELRNEVTNGVPFCRNCHLDFHKQYGVTNNTVKQLEEYLKIKRVNVEGSPFMKISQN